MDRVRARQFALGFACVFLALTLPSQGLGPVYTRAHAALGNYLFAEHPTAAGVWFRFSATDTELSTEPWRMTLRAERPGGQVATFPIDLRGLTFLPLATFIALAAAAPLAHRRSNLVVMGVGLAVLVPLGLVLTALPVVAVLSDAAPVAALSLGAPTRVLVNVAYRALVSPPGMTYAIPLLLFCLLVTTVGHVKLRR